MLEKKYIDGDDMNSHLTFFSMENRKLGKNTFDDEFLAPLMLMCLPCDSTWEALVVILLQSTSDTNKLKTSNVTTHLMQEYRRLTGTESIDSTLTTCTGKSSKPPKAQVRCTYKPC